MALIVGFSKWRSATIDGMAAFAMGCMLFAPVVCGIPSILYTVVMEVAFCRGLQPRSGRALALSTLLGALSGAAMLLRGAAEVRDPLGIVLFSIGLGAGVGLAIGGIVYAAADRWERNGN